MSDPLERIENKLDKCLGDVAALNVSVARSVAIGNERLTAVEKRADAHQEIIKGTHRQPGLEDDVRDLKRHVAKRQKYSWAVVIAFVGAAFKGLFDWMGRN